MVLSIVLTDFNTERKADVGANMTVTVLLTKEWPNLKDYDRFYISTTLIIPVFLNNTIFKRTITLKDHFNIADIITGNDISVIQYGYIEEPVVNVEDISASAYLWPYYFIDTTAREMED